MKKPIMWVAALLTASCTPALKVEVANTTPTERDDETVEIAWSEVAALKGVTPDNIVVLNDDNEQIPSQVLFRGGTEPQALIFQTDADPMESKRFKLVTGQRENYPAEAIAAAHAAGLTVSCDINYRKNLWKYGKEPQEVLPPLMEQCDAFFGTDDEYEKVLGMQLPQFAARDTAYRPDTAGYERASAEVAARFPRCRSIVFGLRSVLSANHHLISGTLYTGGRLHSTRVYDIDPVVDCVGVGDAFVGGLLYGMAAHPHDAQFALDFGTAACALKNTVPGDYNQFTAAEVEQLARGSVSGRIAR